MGAPRPAVGLEVELTFTAMLLLSVLAVGLCALSSWSSGSCVGGMRWRASRGRWGRS
jgi:hypothetical protein